MSNTSNIVITGEWDGEVIWRRKTAAEILEETLHEIEKDKLKKYERPS